MVKSLARCSRTLLLSRLTRIHEADTEDHLMSSEGELEQGKAHYKEILFYISIGLSQMNITYFSLRFSNSTGFELYATVDITKLHNNSPTSTPSPLGHQGSLQLHRCITSCKSSIERGNVSVTCRF
jgi:hypothetical protein